MKMFGGRGASPFGAGGAGGFGGGPGGPQPPPRKGQDLNHRLAISFMTGAKGGREHIRLNMGAGSQTITVKIPPGIEDGGKLRVRGKGQPSPTQGASGDLIVTVALGKHPLFRREGLDLLVDVPITIAEAALGTSVHVPLLSGSVEMKIPAGAGSGRKLRIKEKGITDSKGRVGDFYVVVQIVAPEKLEDQDREMLENLSARLKNPRESGPWTDRDD